MDTGHVTSVPANVMLLGLGKPVVDSIVPLRIVLIMETVQMVSHNGALELTN